MGEVCCANCGFANPAGFNFCGNCGRPLRAIEQQADLSLVRPRSNGRRSNVTLTSSQQTAPSAVMNENAVLTASHLPPDSTAARGERRNITVLFADLSDYTALSSELDPEEIYYIANRALEMMADQVNLYEGTVDKYTGDGIMAVFGAPKAHENNAERALLAALGMMRTLEGLSDELATQLGGRRLQMHLGVNSGVAVGAPVGNRQFQQYTMIGDAVNVAARLLQAAPAGQVVVSDEVFRATEPLFEWSQLPPLRVKGKEGPLTVYELLGPRETRASVRGLPGLRAPLVGREEELAALIGASREWLERGKGQVILVSGEAGIGKSRLTAEWRKLVGAMPQPITILEGVCLSYTHNTPFWPLLDLLRSYLEIGPSDDIALITAKIDAKISAVTPERRNDIAPYVKHLLAVDSEIATTLAYLPPAELRERIRRALSYLLAAEAKRQPLALLFDDLHWADEASIDVISSLYDLLPDLPIFLLLISRPLGEETENRLQSEALARVADRFTFLPIEPLTAGESGHLLTLLQMPDLPPDLLEAITEKAEGNPFYLEELIRMLIHQQVLRERDGRWELVPDTETRYLSVPQNLQDLIMARYDRMSETLKETMATAAVVGRRFYFNPLLQVMPDVTAPELERRLDELEQNYFVRLRTSEPEPEYTFVHTITRETIYNSLLRRTREQLHSRIGAALEEQYAGRHDEYAEELAYHFHNSLLHQKAVEYLVRSGKKAAARYANDEAWKYFRDATETLKKIESSGDVDGYALAIRGGMGDLLVFAGNYQEAHEQFADGLPIAVRLARTGEQASLLRRMAMTHRLRGEVEEARADLFAAIAALEGLALDREEREAAAAVYDELGWLLFQGGQVEEAAINLRQALSYVEGSNAYGVLASIYGHLGGVSFRRSAWTDAARYVSESLRLQEILGDALGQARCYINLGAVSKLQGAWDPAIGYYTRAIAILSRLNHQELLARVYGNLGILLCDSGDLRLAKEHLSRSLTIAQQLDNPYQLTLSLKNMGYYYLTAGFWSEAAECSEQGLSLAQEIGAPELTADIYAALGEIALRQGDLVRAQEEEARALATAESEGVESEEYGRALRLSGRVRQELGEREGAEQLLRKSVAIFAGLQNSYEQAKSLYKLGLLLVGSLDSRGEGLSVLAQAECLFSDLPAPLDMRRTHDALLNAA